MSFLTLVIVILLISVMVKSKRGGTPGPPGPPGPAAPGCDPLQNVKLFVSNNMESTRDLKRFTFLVQVKHVSAIPVGGDIYFVIFVNNEGNEGYNIYPYETTLSNFTTNIVIDPQTKSTIVITYDPKSNEFTIDLSLLIPNTDLPSSVQCNQRDSIEFLSQLKSTTSMNTGRVFRAFASS